MVTELCPDCGVVLTATPSKAVHRYLGGSPSCWQMFSSLHNGGQPAIAPGELNPLLLDAYCVQHHGTPSPQAINSVAVHALALHGVFVAGVAAERVLWIRQRALRHRPDALKHDRFHWLEPPELSGMLTVADIVAAATPALRTEQLTAYVNSVWRAWASVHGSVFARWYAEHVE